MIHKSLMVAAFLVLVTAVSVAFATGNPPALLCVLEYFLLIACGITRPASAVDETSLSDMDLALVTVDDGHGEHLTERERIDCLIDHLSLRTVRTVKHPSELVM